MNNLAVIITHPIQYYSPLFKMLTDSGKISLKVFYTWSQAKSKKYDPGFGKEVEWDIPLLEGYDYTFVENISADPGTHHFKGIINPGLIDAVEQWKPDKLLIMGWNYHSHLKALRYFKGKVLVYFRGDSTLLDEKSFFIKIIRRAFLRWIYKNVDYAFYVGAKNKEYYLTHGLKEDQLIFAPHVIDNERFFDQNKIFKNKAIEWRQLLGIKEDEVVFLFIGKLEPKKNPKLLLNAFLKLNNPVSHLIFVGNGVLEKELKKIVSDTVATLRQSRLLSGQSDNKPNIHFIDFQNQSLIPIVYRLGNVFVLPSQGPGETWGLAVNEAMACGLPVIVSDKVGCAVDLVVNGKNGFIFNSGNSDQLNVCMNEIVNDKNKFKEMGEMSLKKIEDYSMKMLNEIILTTVR